MARISRSAMRSAAGSTPARLSRPPIKAPGNALSPIPPTSGSRRTLLAYSAPARPAAKVEIPQATAKTRWMSIPRCAARRGVSAVARIWIPHRDLAKKSPGPRQWILDVRGPTQDDEPSEQNSQADRHQHRGEDRVPGHGAHHREVHR